MQLSTVLALLPVLASSALAAPLEARQSSTYGWSVSFFNDASCSGTADLTTTAGDDDYFDCQAAGSGPWANGTFFGAKASADGYCHIKFFADTTCTSQVGDEINGVASACIDNPSGGIMAYSASCYR
ncbi:hypothetical protein EV356DRAFT_510722 [Viridothelium virens]|uniref:Uncharacterized protein n=1 Tax=Viridothelium virens TaxID=1048519 RepID=A0A6A6HIS1_VIRVR|nr:hypothetical protein EV356DRAFT_510722 [Viridothelium virens]